MDSKAKDTAVETKMENRILCGWKSLTFQIEHLQAHLSPEESQSYLSRKIIVFIPGNPGLVEWYVPFFERMIDRLGPGFVAYGVSNAGHGIQPDLLVARESNPESQQYISWTIDGQVQHKCAFLDLILEEERRHSNEPPHFIFISHSIGAHFTQRLCVLRPDILERTSLLLHLTPFCRMHAPWDKQILLDFAAGRPTEIISTHKLLAQTLSQFPNFIVDILMRKTVPDTEGRRIAVELLRQPKFVENFFRLGLEEIRDVPERFDISAMRLIGQQCPTAMLFAGNDHWSPQFHISDLHNLQSRGLVPSHNISLKYLPAIEHSFISFPDQVSPVLEFCVSNIRKHVPIRSNL